MKAIVYDQEGKEAGSIMLPKEIFDVAMNSDLLHQVVVSQMSNRRQGSAHTKDRSEVSGGGRKPWRQKGTGRARVGSNRSPIWKGGGVTFGPRNDKIFKKEIPEKIRRKALFMVLTEKFKRNLLTFVEDLNLEKPKTAEMVKILKNVKCKENCLIVFPEYDKKIILAARNLPGYSTVEARNLNVLEVMTYKNLLITKDAVKKIKDTFVKIK
ncbi:MAG: 50S ribosomal protein L4 [Candidatus Staskawiczbacteria bacterium]|jgi:large subunit ribosomal protein L4